MYRILGVFAATLLVPSPVVGQRLESFPTYAPAPIGPIPEALRVERILTDSAATIPRTYWLEGSIIGAVTVGVLGTVWFRGMSDSRPGFGATVAVGVLCGAAGFGPGALIGGQFRKSTKTRPRAP